MSEEKNTPFGSSAIQDTISPINGAWGYPTSTYEERRKKGEDNDYKYKLLHALEKIEIKNQNKLHIIIDVFDAMISDIGKEQSEVEIIVHYNIMKGVYELSIHLVPTEVNSPTSSLTKKINDEIRSTMKIYKDQN